MDWNLCLIESKLWQVRIESKGKMKIRLKPNLGSEIERQIELSTSLMGRVKGKDEQQLLDQRPSTADNKTEHSLSLFLLAFEKQKAAFNS